MTKVTITPGPCGNVSVVEAEMGERKGRNRFVTVRVESACAAITKMFEELGTSFNATDILKCRPGQAVFYEYAKEHFPSHASCPSLAGIIKCIEAEAGYALPKDVSIRFEA